MGKFLEEKMNVDLEIRSLSEKIKDGSIKADDAKAQLEQLRARKIDIEKQIALKSAPQNLDTRENEYKKTIADIASAMQEKRAITISGTGVTYTVRELVKIMSAKKPILGKVRYFYGANASTVIPVWGTSLTRPAPVAEGGTITAEAAANLGNKTLVTQAYATSVPVSEETLKLSAVDFESELQDILAEAFADAMAYEIFSGTGSGGHFASVVSNAGITQESATASTLKISDLATFALNLADKTDNGCIFMSPTVYNAFISDTSDTQKVYREDLIRNKTIEGVPVILTSYAPTSTADGARVAVAGDFGNYAVAVAGEMSIVPKQTAGKLQTTFDVSMYMNGAPVINNNFYALTVKSA